MPRLITVFWIAGLLVMAGCSNSETSRIASSFCDCYMPVVEAVDRLEQGLRDSLPIEKTTALADAVVYARINSKSCLKETLQQQKMAGITDSLLAAEMRQLCPAVYAYYNNELSQ